MKTTQIKASDVKGGDIILDHEDNEVKVLCSFRDGDGAGSSWHIEAIREGKPTLKIRGAPDQAIDVVSRA